MEFSFFTGEPKGKKPVREEKLKDVKEEIKVKPEERENLFRKMAKEHASGIGERALSNIRKFSHGSEDMRTEYLPEISFQNKVLQLVANKKVNDLSKFATEYTRYFIEEKNRDRKEEITPEEALNIQEYILSRLRGVEEVAAVVEDIDQDFMANPDYIGLEETIATNDTLDAKYKVDLTEIIRDPVHNEILEVVLIQVKRGKIDPKEEEKVYKAHEAYAASLMDLAEASAFKDVQSEYEVATKEKVIERRVALLTALHEKYGYFWEHFREQSKDNTNNSLTDEQVGEYLKDVGASFSIDQLATLLKTGDAREIFNITDEDSALSYLESLEKWTRQHHPNEEDVFMKIPEQNIARAHTISSVIVDYDHTFAEAYKERKILKKREVLTEAA